MTNVPPEVPVQSSLDGLAPLFAQKVQILLSRVPYAKVAETTRTNARQVYLYGFGRDYDDGRGIVTHSHDALDTWHHYGLACDIIHSRYGWDARWSWWMELGHVARTLGLTWGGDWKMADNPHVQWGPPMRRSPSPSAAKLWAMSPDALWREVGAV